MPIEIEAKMRLPDKPALEAALAAAGASHNCVVLEENILFDTRQSSLLASDRGLRFRIERDASTKVVTRTSMTYKGPRTHSTLKSRREIEIPVDVSGVEATIELFAELGYLEVVRYEKVREIWNLDNCVVDIDELPYLGHFVEIESTVETHVLAARKKLGLASSPIVKSSYISMLLTHLNEIGLRDTHVRFSR